MFGREVQLPIDVMFGLTTGSGQPTNVPVYVKELRNILVYYIRSHLYACKCSSHFPISCLCITVVVKFKGLIIQGCK